jgi:hypothetical protein
MSVPPPQYRTVVLAIHGVGNPQKGEIERALAKNFDDGAVASEVTEINWNAIADQPLSPKGDFIPSSLKTVISNLANLEFIGSGVNTRARSSPAHTRVSNIQETAFSLSENCLSFACVSITVLQPIMGFMFIIALGADAPAMSWLFPMVLFKWALYGVVISLVGFLLCGLALAISTRSAVPCNVAARRAGVLLLRPFLLVVFCPLLFPWRSFLRGTWRWTRGSARYIAGFVVIYVTIARLVFVIGLRQQVVATLGPLAIVFLKFYGVILLGTLLAWICGFGVKILLDIFRYAGEPTYRTRIQEFVSTVVTSSRGTPGEAAHFVVLAHSLGSVIAVDSLLNSDAWLNSDRVTLVTMGSPLKRFFFRLFPTVFFPDSADVCAKALCHRFAGFRWINCYRPFDQIGTRIGLTKTSFTRDWNTKQFGRILAAHPNYWGDSRVRDEVLALYRELEFAHVPQAPCFRSFGEVDGIVAKWFGRLIARLLLITVSLSPIASIPLGIAGAWYRHHASAALLEKLQQHGVHTSASVSYWIEDTGSSHEDGTPVVFPHFTFRFRDERGRPLTRDYIITLRYIYPYSQVRSRMDRDRLLDFIMHTGKPPVTADHFGELVVDGVKVSYLPEDPTYVYVTQFPPTTDLLTDCLAVL